MTETEPNGTSSPASGNQMSPRPIVGIGASAGGLESLKQFLATMPADSGAGDVVRPHLQHGRQSIMAEIMANYTTMPVREIAHGEPVAANTINVLPSDRLATIQDGILYLENWTGGLPQRAPIDEFFQALATDQGRNALAIVMSGAGSDGTLGVRAIKDHGGMTMAEALSEPRTTPGHESMPQSAWATGVVDFVVPAREMPEQIATYAHYLGELRAGQGAADVDGEAFAVLPQIQTLLLENKGRDFRDYKPNTLSRRIQRRMQLLRLNTGAAYLQRLRSDPTELERLAGEFLIAVTGFFRDPAAFEALKRDVLARVMRTRHQDQGVRIWLVGCSTGEEAYSVAILVQELREELNIFVPVRIFATDIDPAAIDTARSAIYPVAIAADVSEARLERFFLRENDHYRVRKDIRDFCIFSEHNIIQNAPFWKMDLVVCRNLLIYLESNFQRRFMPLIHYALREGGYLFLGASENVTQGRDLFRVLDQTHRIFQRRDDVVRPEVQFPLPAPSARDPAVAHGNRLPAQPAFAQRIERVVLHRYSPAYVVVDESFGLVHFSPGTGLYLEQPGGAPRSNLLDLIHPALRTAMRTALHRASQVHAEAQQRDLAITTARGEITLDLMVAPFTETGQRPFFVVVFKQTGRREIALEAPPENDTEPAVEGADASEGSVADGGHDSRSADRVRALERELAATRADLQTTIEELETSNEELQSTNEELRSMNEELQSANEELQSAKEETQSINDELDRKIAEVNQANDDLNNLLESTDIATVFLDDGLRIKWFAPEARRVFRLIETDVGRPITDITADFDATELTDDLRAVLHKQVVCERTVHLAEDGHMFTMRLRPYLTGGGHANGVVMTFQDITDLVEAARRQTFLVSALQHRVRNVLSTVRSLARESRETSESLDEFFERFDGRVHALSVSESIVTRSRDGRVDFDELVREAVPDALRADQSVHIDGESVGLDPRAAQMMALALNELATNAIKFGALAHPAGRLDVTWRSHEREGGRRLRVTWAETGIAGPVTRPEVRGFGLSLIEDGIPYELHGHGEVVFGAQDVTCTLEIPLDAPDCEGAGVSGSTGREK